MGRARYFLGVTGLIVLGMAALLAAAGPASARPLMVCPSGCVFPTIASAVANASDGDTIVVGPGTYAGGFTISNSVDLIGAGAGQTAISGGAPVVTITAGQVVIRGVTITGGNNQSGNGGGVLNDGTLTLTESVVSGNSVAIPHVGGGIFNRRGTLTLANSDVSNNAGFGGGGILNTVLGTVTLANSTVDNNTAAVFGGGILNNGMLTLADSSVDGNTAQAGGGIFNRQLDSFPNQLTLKNSTVSGDTAFVGGGGIVNAGGTVTLLDGVVTGNTPDNCEGSINGFC
jgi:hypothetical protein